MVFNSYVHVTSVNCKKLIFSIWIDHVLEQLDFSKIIENLGLTWFQKVSAFKMAFKGLFGPILTLNVSKKHAMSVV